jgi:hypothetical protein
MVILIHKGSCLYNLAFFIFKLILDHDSRQLVNCQCLMSVLLGFHNDLVNSSIEHINLVQGFDGVVRVKDGEVKDVT